MFVRNALGDWRLNLAEQVDDGRARVWNHDVILVTDGAGVKPVPVAPDFDLASVVTGRIGPGAGTITPEVLDKQLTEFLAKTEGLSDENVAQAKNTFLAKKDALYKVVNEAQCPDADRALAKMHIDAFYRKL